MDEDVIVCVCRMADVALDGKDGAAGKAVTRSIAVTDSVQVAADWPLLRGKLQLK